LEDAATFSSKNYTRSSYRVLKRALKVGEKMTRSQKASQRQVIDQIAAIDKCHQRIEIKNTG